MPHPAYAASAPRAVHRPRRTLAALFASLTLAACSELPSAPSIPPLESSPEAAGGNAPVSNPIRGATLYVNPASAARRAADEARHARPAAAPLLEKIAAQPQAIWLGDWVTRPYEEARRITATVSGAGAVPVFVLYAIPLRDCGQYSAGGAASADAYQSWIADVARGIGSERAVVVLEPDGLAGLDCLSAREQEARITMIRRAVESLTRSGSISVYLDAGNARWLAPAAIADRLRRAGIDMAAGFALNVSNFVSDAESLPYGEALSREVGGKHFLLDTSRNGLGPTGDSQWCNPAGRALGRSPTTDTGHPLVDAFLWIKTPGESDGQCNGGPGAGQWWTDYALGLARRANW